MISGVVRNPMVREDIGFGVATWLGYELTADEVAGAGTNIE